jgi:hypothetical protein|tara:strand:+ start:107 stop:352 length:246 start_codon:yes stop_codon:yes gene_type:complete
MNDGDEIVKRLKQMQYHFSAFIELYESLPRIQDVVRRTVLEDAISVVGATMDGITHEIIDSYQLQAQMKILEGNENENEYE